MKKKLICSSCYKSIQEGATIFECPACGKQKIVRCNHCKKVGIKYKCGNCGFEGPN